MVLAIAYQIAPVSAQTVPQLKAVVRDAVDRGDLPVAIARLGWLISLLDDPAERAEYQAYRDSLEAFYYEELSDAEKIYLQMAGAGRELAAMRLGGESAYLNAVVGATPTDNADGLATACLNELQVRLHSDEPLRFTSQPLIVELDPGVYNLSGVVSGPERGRYTRRWRYHCLLRHDELGIEALIANIWL